METANLWSQMANFNVFGLGYTCITNNSQVRPVAGFFPEDGLNSRFSPML